VNDAIDPNPPLTTHLATYPLNPLASNTQNGMLHRERALKKRKESCSIIFPAGGSSSATRQINPKLINPANYIFQKQRSSSVTQKGTLAILLRNLIESNHTLFVKRKPAESQPYLKLENQHGKVLGLIAVVYRFSSAKELNTANPEKKRFWNLFGPSFLTTHSLNSGRSYLKKLGIDGTAC